MSLSDEKKAARQAAFARRKEAHAVGADVAAQDHLARLIATYRGAALSGYLPIRTEIDPRPVMADWTRDGAVGVPVIEGRGQPLRFRRWTSEAKLVEGPFGARVPESAEEVIPSVLIVPLVAFDRRGMRLGYGGGFYDRTLEGLRRRGPILAVGFAYAAQQAEELPLEPTDQPLDAIVTEEGVLRFDHDKG